MICIDISAEYIDIVVARGKNTNITVDFATSIMSPQDLFRDNTDINFERLEECLTDTFERFSDKQIVISFSFLPTVYSTLSLHKERNRQQQRLAIESQVYTNISAEEYYVDYCEAEGITDDESKQNYVSYAIPKNIVQSSYKMLKRLGKTPIALIPAQHAAQQFIATYFPNRVISLAKLGSNGITLHLLNPPDNIITRNIAISTEKIVSLDPFVAAQDDAPQAKFLQNIEKLNSYQSIKFPGNPIEQLFVFGNKPDNTLCDVISETVGIDVNMLSDVRGEFDSGIVVYTLGSMLCAKKNDINLFKVAKEQRSQKASRPINIPLILCMVAVLLNLAVLAGLLYAKTYSAKLVEQKQTEVDSPQNQQLLDKYDLLRAEYVGMLKSEIDLKALPMQLAETGEFDRQIISSTVSVAPSGIAVVSFSYSGTTYNFSCVGQTEQQASDYVEALTMLNIFNQVRYYGFSQSGDTVNFTITGERDGVDGTSQPQQ